MIQSLKIQNFQSHNESTLEFVPGLNVIVGSTDSGKTSIIRALRWLVWNRPGGEAFRSDWGGETKVTLELKGNTYSDENPIIIREKDKENMYTLLGITDMGVKEYKAFKTNVPEPIQQALNIGDVNLQTQLSPHFLLSKSPGEVAAYFNRIAHLEKIDTATRYIMSGLRDLERSQKQDVKEIETLEEEFTTYDYLDKVEAELEVLEDLEKNWETKIKQKASLEATISFIDRIEKEKEKYDRTLSLKKPVEELLELYEKKEATWQVLDALQEVSAEITQAESNIEYNKTILATIPPHLDLLLNLHTKRKKIAEKMKAFDDIIADIDTRSFYLKKYKEKLEKLETEFHNNMPETCPLCNTVLK